MISMIFHWWLAALLTIVGVLLVVAVAAGYVKAVVAPQYPDKRHRSED